MGAGQQILLCQSLESGPLTDYLDKVKQQRRRQQPELHPLSPSRLLLQTSRVQPNARDDYAADDDAHSHNLNSAENSVQEQPTDPRNLNSTTSQLYEAIKCVFNWLDDDRPPPAVGIAREEAPTAPGNRQTPARVAGNQSLLFSQLLQSHEEYTGSVSPAAALSHSATDKLDNRSSNSNPLQSLLGAEPSHPLLVCRLRETLHKYYNENCVLEHLQEATAAAVAIPLIDGHRIDNLTTATHISSTISAALATTTGVIPDLGSLLGNGSIMDNSLTGDYTPTAISSLASEQPPPLTYHWNFLFFVIIFIIAGGLGNILVCLAIALDRKLQNVTNYFLLSLAIADLLVSLFVMPLGAIPTFLGGHWPLGEHWCNVYVTCDVLACSASIWHMCFISLGRYLGIKNPLGSRHRSTKRIVGIKIAVCWLMAMPVSSSIAILGSIDMQNIIPQPNVCTINNKQFFVYGSLVAFYIPMVIMVSTYALTVQLLRKKARFAAAHPESEIFRSLMSHRLGGTNRYHKHSTGGAGCNNSSGGGVGIGQREAPSLKPTPQQPPYLRGKVKSISETDLGKSLPRPLHHRQQHPQNTAHLDPCEFDRNHRAFARDQASASTMWKSQKSLLRPLAHSLAAHDTQQQHSGDDCTTATSQLVHERPARCLPAVIRRNKSSDKGIGSQDHKTWRAGGGISKKRQDSRIATRKNMCPGDTCDQATQTSPGSLGRSTAERKGHKLKLNIQSVTSPYLNFNLRLPKNRRKTSLSANAVANEQKATKVLGIVFFTFVLCWAPFFVLNIVMVLYPRENIPDHVIDVCLWLGYVSSTINPIIYTIFNRTFRAAFIRLLRCNCQRSGRPYRYRSVNETKGAASLCARSALPLAISLQGTGYFGPQPVLQSSVSTDTAGQQNPSNTVTDSEC